MAKSFVTKENLMRFIKDAPEDSVFMIGSQEVMDMEEEWDTGDMVPISSIGFFREKDKTIIVFGTYTDE